MAAYKKDINLFKAAGGERAKAKKMAASKKLILVAIVVVLLVGGAIGGLYYFNKTFEGRLEKLETQAQNYSNTQRGTRSLLTEYKEVQSQAQTAALLEYQSMLSPSFSTDLSREEIMAIRNYLSQDTTGYTIDNNFDDVVDDILGQLNLVQYSDATTYADDIYKASFLYGALSFMKTMRPVFASLPLQYIEENADGTGDAEEYYWYCYYRGKFVMMLRATTGNDAVLATQLQDPALLGADPFCSLDRGISTVLDADFATYTTVSVGDANTQYVVIAITCKTVPERFLDCVENIFSQQMGSVAYRYEVSNFKFEAESSTFSVDFLMTQTDEFVLKDVCDAVTSSPFFVTRMDYAYEISDAPGVIQRTLRFGLNNEAINATLEEAVNFFTIVEETEEEEE